MKKRVIIISVIVTSLILTTVIIFLILNGKEEQLAIDHQCKNTPLSEDCLKIIKKPVFDDSIVYGEKYVFNETFSEDFINAQPFSWLLYRSDTYKIGAVEAKVLENETKGKYVSLYSDGMNGPLYYPIDRSLIFTRQFNLNELGYGVAEAEVFIPSVDNNEVYFEVASGAVNVLGINIKQDGKLTVNSGGVFFNYQGTIDITDPKVTLTKDKWYKFRLEWNREQDLVKAYMYNDSNELVKLHEGKFHISVRENTKREGLPIAPNIVRFTTHKIREGFFYIDNIRVDAVIEAEGIK